MEQKYKFGLIKNEGVWNESKTRIYPNSYFEGYKPIQSVEIFGLINSTDGNFWFIGEDDDYYWTIAKISEETIKNLYNKLINNDFTDIHFTNGIGLHSDINIFKMKDDIIELSIINLHNNKIVTREFHKDWIPSLIKTLDIDNPIISNNEILPIWEKSLVPDKIEYPMMTPEEYVYSKIQSSPDFYIKEDFEITKFNIYDELFNSLNSHNGTEEFIDTISKIKEIDYSRVERLLKEPTYIGYKNVEELDLCDRTILLPITETCIARGILEDEKGNYPEVIFWQKNSTKNLNEIMNERKGLIINTKFGPYPNFKKEYSTLWINKDELFDKLSQEWIKEIIWFYQTSLDAIENGCFKDHIEFPTGSEKEDEKIIEEYKKILKNQSLEEISKNYNCEYNYNIPEFLSKRWIKTKMEYKNFINEILGISNEFLENKDNNFIER